MPRKTYLWLRKVTNKKKGGAAKYIFDKSNLENMNLALVGMQKHSGYQMLIGCVHKKQLEPEPLYFWTITRESQMMWPYHVQALSMIDDKMMTNDD